MPFRAVAALALAGLMAAGQPAAAHAKAVAFEGGRWWTGAGYRAQTFYAVDGVLRSERPDRVDEVIDLKGGYVIPPLAEAHNHWLEPAKVQDYNACYLADGVFYVRDLGNLPLLADQIRPQLNLPTTVDWVSAMTGFTGPGGHGVEIVDQFVAFGILPKSWKPDYDKQALFVVRTRSDVDERFELLLRQRPAIVKAFLLYSDRYQASLTDPAMRGNGRGMDPALLPHLVQRAHAAGLKVAAHIYSAADFRNAVAAGVDEIAHFPGSGFRADMPVSDFQITRADALAAARAKVIVHTTLSWLPELQESNPVRYAVARNDVVIPNMKLLRQAGVPIIVGSDQFRRTVRPELEVLRGLGVFSDAELLRMATGATARVIFPGRKIGKLADGHEADFLVLDRDPAADLTNLASLRTRVKDGRPLVLPAAAMARPGPDCVSGPP